MNYPLRTLFWEATLRCNAFCKFCGSRCGESFAEELSTEEVLRCFREVAESFDARSIMINVTGGEPLLRKDLFIVMRQCAEMGYPWGMVSNGTLITQEIVDAMRRSKMRTISISIDGLRDTHDNLRKLDHGFERAMRAIDLLRAAAFLDHIQVTTVATEQNMGDLDDLYALLRTKGIDSWRVAMVDPIGRASDHQDLLLSSKSLKRYIDFIRSHVNDPVLPVLTSCSHYLGRYDAALGRGPFQCEAGKKVASILANGDIFVCPNVPKRPELIQGNIRRDSFVDVWNGGFHYFRNPDSRKMGQCATCDDWESCRGDSLHTWDFENNRPNFCSKTMLSERDDADEMMTMEALVDKLKAYIPDLGGIRIHQNSGATHMNVFTPNASKELFDFFHWGKEHPLNLSEQLAALIGHRYADFTLIEFVSPAFLEKRNEIQAFFSEKSYQSGMEEAAAINLAYAKRGHPMYSLDHTPCSLLGFVHSHPADVPFVPSEPDEALLRKLTELLGNASLMIVNPQKRHIMMLDDAGLSNVLLLMPKSEIPHWGLKPTRCGGHEAKFASAGCEGVSAWT